MKTVILRGYYGRDNLGDELMKTIFINYLKSKDVDLYVMNSAPEQLMNEHGIQTPEELKTGKSPTIKNLFKRLRRIAKADLYIYGGGTILTDKHGWFHLAENAVYFVIRRLLKKKSALISVGSTKLKSLKGKALCKTLIKSSSVSSIRDTNSYRMLQELTGNSNKLLLASDMVLLSADIIERDVTSIKNKVGLCLMPYYYATFHDRTQDEKLFCDIVDALRMIHSQYPELSFELIPIQYGLNDKTDYDFSKRIYDALSQEINISIFKDTDINKKIHRLIECEYLISMRLHALMLSRLCENNVVAINHNEKISYFMKRYDSAENMVSLESIAALPQVFSNIQGHGVNTIKKEMNADHDLAYRNLKVIGKMLSS